MAPNELPPRPSLEQLRKRAKDLLKAARSEEAAAIARLQKQLSGHAARVQLADALTSSHVNTGFRAGRSSRRTSRPFARRRSKSSSRR
jgi:hypothetical protein